tara:strand:- start:27196 stop:27420 length:225 start_codon:yes stop_codon:yes gene_type:complete
LLEFDDTHALSAFGPFVKFFEEKRLSERPSNHFFWHVPVSDTTFPKYPAMAAVAQPTFTIPVDRYASLLFFLVR